MNYRRHAKQKEYKQSKQKDLQNFLIIHNCIDGQKIGTFYQLYVKESLDLKIHFVQLNFFKLFLFKNQKNLCQNNRCEEEQKALDA